MYKGIKFFVLCFSLALLNGCASSCGSSVETNSNQQANEVIVPKQATNAKIPQDTNTMINGAANINTNNPTLDNSKVKKIDTSKVKSQPPVKKLADNSEVSAQSVGALFVETRKFNNHPQLEKVEKIFEGKDIKYKVYLKDGKTSELTESKLKDFRKATASDILTAVGVKPVADKSQNSKENAVQEKEKMNKTSGSN